MVRSLGVTAAALLANTAMPDLHALALPPPWLVPVGLLVVVPCALASAWGLKHIDPALVGILFMTEITVGGITAALWAGEPFGLRELVGVLLISAPPWSTAYGTSGRPGGLPLLVRSRGLEPPRCYPLAPQASASTNSATTALPGECGVSTRLTQIKRARYRTRHSPTGSARW